MRGDRRAICIVLAALAAGCGSDTVSEQVDLSWRFIDGRPCDLAGVSDVVIVGAGPYPRHVRCDEGEAPAGSVSVEVVGAPVTLVAEGRSHAGALLYRGEADVAPGQGALTITLRFVGGEGSRR